MTEIASDRGEPTARLAFSRFEDFYHAHRDEVARALTVTLGDPLLGAEAADEAMARAYQRWRSVRSYANPAGWAYRVGLNWVRSRFRRRRRELLGIPYEPPTWDPEPADPAVGRAVRALPEKHRAVVVLRYSLEWSHEEIAQALGIPVGTVKSRLHRALARLRQELGS